MKLVLNLDVSCVSLSAAPVSFASTPSIVHLKGFASRIVWQQSWLESIVADLKAFETIVWDGDDCDVGVVQLDQQNRVVVNCDDIQNNQSNAFNGTSYTFVLLYFLSQIAMQTESSLPTFPQLVAFKYDSGKQVFLESWNRSFVFHVNSDDDCSDEESNFTIPIQCILLPKSSSSSSSSSSSVDKFARLGIEALAITNATNVFCIGGGDVLMAEYLSCIERAKEESELLLQTTTSTGHKIFNWRIWPISRPPKSNGHGKQKQKQQQRNKEECFWLRLPNDTLKYPACSNFNVDVRDLT